MLWELLRFLSLSEDGEDRRAIDRLTQLAWMGDSLEQKEKWYHEALLACDGAAKAGVTNGVIVARLQECSEKTPGLSTPFSKRGSRSSGGVATWNGLSSCPCTGAACKHGVPAWLRLRQMRSEAKGPSPLPAQGRAVTPRRHLQGLVWETA